MSALNFDDPAIEEQWCSERRAQVTEYLQRQGVKHGRVGEWPAWRVAPYVSIWAIESVVSPEWVGWWAVCGDLPTDYISADKIKHPREAMRAIAQRWLAVSECMKRWQKHPEIQIGGAEEQPQLGCLLEVRGHLLLEWAKDDSCWERERN